MENQDRIKDAYSLSEIAKWQIANSEGTITLPDIQRGFVWRPHQIETLWDSILRGYPIGVFSVSDSGHLYDGQQRSTAIALGFYNPWEEGNTHFWKLKKYLPTVWIDLNPERKSVGSDKQFLIRVCTRSHPWGYQAKKNSEILSLRDRRDALERLQKIKDNKKKKKYTDFNIRNVSPFDATCPVPLSWLLEIVEKNKKQDLAVIKTELLKRLETTNLESVLKKEWDELNDFRHLEKIVEGIKGIKEIKVPILVIQDKLLQREKGDNTDEDSEDEALSDPTLFIRLNSAGTRIEGEELIYSLLKAEFPKLVELDKDKNIQKINAFLPLSRIAFLSSRLVFSTIDGKYSNPVTKVGEFRDTYLSKEGFKDKFQEFIEQGTIGILFKRVLDIFSSEKMALPPVLIKQLLSNNTELLLLLLNWLHNHPDSEEKGKEKIVRYFMHVAWFCKSEDKKDYKRDYVKNVWKNVKEEGLWKKPNFDIKNSKEEYIMPPPIDPEDLKEMLGNNVVKKQVSYDDLFPSPNSKIYKFLREYVSDDKRQIKDNVNKLWDGFIIKLRGNQSILLFAQRAYINKAFGDFNQLDSLEDTNTPWDWDHIYPRSYIYGEKRRKHNQDDRVVFWNNTIGNLRALSLEDNRREKDRYSPSERLKTEDEQTISFITEENYRFWKKIEGPIDGEKVTVDDHLNAVLHRLCNIYGEWYHFFKMDKTTKR